MGTNTTTKGNTTAKAATKAAHKAASASTSKVHAAGGNTSATPTGLAVVVASASKPVTGPTLLAAAQAGTVTFAKVRGTGTLRHWPVLAPGSNAHKAATAYATALAGGTAVVAIAKANNTSVPTVRRALTALAFTNALASQPATVLATYAKQANALAAKGKPAKATKAATPAPATKPAPKASTKAKPAKPAKASPRANSATVVHTVAQA